MLEILLCFTPALPQQIDALPALPEGRATADWLVDTLDRAAGVFRTDAPDEIALDNGLVRRTYRLAPDAATIALDDLMTGRSVLRGVKPEARIVLDGKPYAVGGLVGQPNYAYLDPAWVDDLEADAAAFHVTGWSVGAIEPRFEWKRVRHSEDRAWPPPGKRLSIDFAAPEGSPHAGVVVTVHCQLYDGLPAFSKWLTIRNGTAKTVRLDSFVCEELAIVEHESKVDAAELAVPNVHAETDYSCSGFNHSDSNLHAVRWKPDPQYSTQVNYRRLTPTLLEIGPELGPAVDIAPGETFESIRAFVLVHDSTERERKGLALRRMYRTIAPWVTENPIMMHVRSAQPDAVKLAVDQCADVGFEMIILTFGSGFNVENTDPAYIEQWKELCEYARSRDVEMGGYSLLSSRSIGPETDAINKETGKPGGTTHGNLPCLCSEWGAKYFEKLENFYAATTFRLLEHDGSYPGDPCASTGHPGHHGYEDSRWKQFEVIQDFYRWCRAEGVYLNVPDYYYLNGSNKCGMGYRETNWSLPRAQQIVHARQNMFDGTWEKTPSMGWMFVPLTEYHGGGAAATMEPLAEHLDDYEKHLQSAFGFGVQACYRGPRLYDTDETRAVVKKWVDFFKEHRAILESDVVHVRRADARDLDCVLHVNPKLATKGMAVVYNPLDRAVERTLRLPLYYTGLTDRATVREQGGEARTIQLNRRYEIEVKIALGAGEMTWLTME